MAASNLTPVPEESKPANEATPQERPDAWVPAQLRQPSPRVPIEPAKQSEGWRKLAGAGGEDPAPASPALGITPPTPVAPQIPEEHSSPAGPTDDRSVAEAIADLRSVLMERTDELLKRQAAVESEVGRLRAAMRPTRGALSRLDPRKR